MNETVMQRVWGGQWRRLGRYAASAAVAVLLAACGGGSDSTGSSGGAGGSSCSRTFTDSFGNTVSCTTMRALPGAELVSGADNGGDAGAGDAGADGTGADGAPIANATIRITDVAGKTVTTTTNASGYFRVNIGGLKQPLVASVQRSNNAWRSALVEVIQPGRSAFYTLNLTGLTDLVLAEVATAAGVTGGSDAVTPSVLAANSARVATAVQAVNQRVSAQLQAAGINPATFNPLSTAFQANSTGYDLVLDSVTITKTSGGSTTVDTSGGSGSLAGKWSMTVTEDGSSYTAPDQVDGTGVPSSASIAGVNYNSVLAAANGTYTGDGFTVTTNGNTVTVVGPDINMTYTINNFVVTNYSGCGSCGVGSEVSFAYTYSITFSGTVSGQPVSATNLSGTASIRYVRVS
jgi:hypothetical protein